MNNCKITTFFCVYPSISFVSLFLLAISFPYNLLLSYFEHLCYLYTNSFLFFSYQLSFSRNFSSLVFSLISLFLCISLFYPLSFTLSFHFCFSYAFISFQLQIYSKIRNVRLSLFASVTFSRILFKIDVSFVWCIFL